MSFLFSDLSAYISHIPENTSGIFISKSSDKKEIFTCGTHLNLQVVKSKTRPNLCKCKMFKSKIR
jgi:hypothetical protein